MQDTTEKARQDFEYLLGMIKAKSKRQEILNIFTQANPTHHQRIYLVGFLGAELGLSQQQIFELIDKNNGWDDYNSSTTKIQIWSVFKSSRNLRGAL